MDMQAFEERMKKQAQFVPKAVVERNKGVFNAEVVFQGSHYIVGRNFKTWEEAQQFAENHRKAVEQAMIVGGLSELEGYPKAKE